MNYTEANRSYWLTALGLISFLLGCLVYLLLYANKFDLGFAKYPVSPPLLQHVVHSLPSFLHVIAFTLLALATYSQVSRSHVVVWSLFWGAVNGLCEYLQNYEELPFRTSLPSILVRYFESGTFDPLDLIAIVLGVILILFFTPVLRNDQ